LKKAPSTARRLVVLLAAFALLAFLLLVPMPDSMKTIRGALLDDKGRRALACLVFALVLWIGEALPFHISGILAMLLLAFLGVQPWPDLVKAGMGDESVIFFVAVLLLAAALAKSGLASRLIKPFLKMAGGSTRGAVFAVLAAGAFLAPWITALAAAALVLPSAKAILDAEGERPGESRFGTAIALAVAWGPLIGACATPAGSGSNPIVVRFLAELAGLDISFVQWMALGVPLTLVLLPLGWLILILLFPPERKRLRSVGADSRSSLGIGAGSGSGAAVNDAADTKPLNDSRPGATPRTSLSRGEKGVGIVFAIVVALWLATPLVSAWMGIKLTVSAVACLGAIALFLPGVTGLSWKDLASSIDWAGILLIATGVALGTALYKSGAAAWVAAAVLGGIGALQPFGRLAAMAAGVLLVKVVFSSNTLTGTVIVPLIIALGATLGIDSRLLALAGGFTANFAVILVTTSPVNVLPWSTGYFSIRDMAKAGLVFAPFVALAVALVFTVLAPAIGL
jgi:sodium-dependent dicarboxylate transporter 2/3/5